MYNVTRLEVDPSLLQESCKREYYYEYRALEYYRPATTDFIFCSGWCHLRTRFIALSSVSSTERCVKRWAVPWNHIKTTLIVPWCRDFLFLPVSPRGKTFNLVWPQIGLNIFEMNSWRDNMKICNLTLPEPMIRELGHCFPSPLKVPGRPHKLPPESIHGRKPRWGVEKWWPCPRGSLGHGRTRTNYHVALSYIRRQHVAPVRCSNLKVWKLSQTICPPPSPLVESAWQAHAADVLPEICLLESRDRRTWRCGIPEGRSLSS